MKIQTKMPHSFTLRIKGHKRARGTGLPHAVVAKRHSHHRPDFQESVDVLEVKGVVAEVEQPREGLTACVHTCPERIIVLNLYIFGFFPSALFPRVPPSRENPKQGKKFSPDKHTTW